MRLRADAAILLAPRPKERGRLDFNLAHWGVHAGDKRHKPQMRNFCGTAACGLGEIALSGQSPLKAKWLWTDPETVKATWSISARSPLAAKKGAWSMTVHCRNAQTGKLAENFYAAEAYYGIDGAVAQKLFHPSHYEGTEDGRLLREDVGRRMIAMAEEFEFSDHVEFLQFVHKQNSDIQAREIAPPRPRHKAKVKGKAKR